jgi:hypothetical protein
MTYLEIGLSAALLIAISFTVGFATAGLRSLAAYLNIIWDLEEEKQRLLIELDIANHNEFNHTTRPEQHGTPH